MVIKTVVDGEKVNDADVMVFGEETDYAKVTNRDNLYEHEKFSRSKLTITLQKHHEEFWGPVQ